MHFDSIKSHIMRIWRLPSKAGAYPIIFWILILLICIQIIRLIWVIVNPVNPVGDWKNNNLPIITSEKKSKIFATIDPFSKSNDNQSYNNVVTSLDLILHGTRVNEASAGGSAIISGEDGVQNSYAVGDEIISGATLHEVAFDHVIIDRSGSKESLYLDQSIPAETINSGNALRTSENDAEDVKITSQTIQRSVNFQPRNINNKITGIEVSPNINNDPEGRIFEAVGFLSGDIIVSVNDRKIASIADITSLQSQIAPGARLSVMVERGAETIPVSINLEE